MTVLTLAGKPIDFANPPAPTTKVMWSQRDTGGDKIIGSFRAICHLEDMQEKCIKRFGKPFRVIQPMNNTGVTQSAGTHDYDFCIDADIPGVSWNDTNHFFRSNGHGGWVRTPAQGFSYHWHGFTLPPREGKSISDDFKVHGFKVGKYVDGGYSTSGRLITSSQIADYYAKAFGLANRHTPGSDKTWYPADIAATIFDLPAFIARKAGKPVPTKPPKAQPIKPPVSGGLRVDGVDISDYQGGTLDMPAAKRAGVKWVYHKATEGTSIAHKNYSRRRAEAKRAGLPFGAYHFASPDGGDAVAEAKHFLAVAKPVPGDMLPMLDFEDRGSLSGAAVAKWITEFSNEVKRQIGVRPVIYTMSDWDLGASNEKYHRIWRARYNADNRLPARRWDIFQFSNGVLGTPNRVAGFGNVDLNTMREGLHTRDLMIPAKATKPPKAEPVLVTCPTCGTKVTPDKIEHDEPAQEPAQPAASGGKPLTLRIGHCSMQFSDGPLQMGADVEVLFKRDYDILTGTEAGAGADPLLSLLKAACKKYGYHFSPPGRYDTWVAVKNDIIKGGWDISQVHALDRSSRTKPAPPGRWGDKGIVAAHFSLGAAYGDLSVGTVHPLTNGGAGPAYKKVSDEKYMEVVEEWGEKYGADEALCFITGDFNKRDRDHDLFLGAPFASCWDDLKTWPNTGHGNIDAIARYKPDGRVKCIKARAFTDEQVFLNTDHFLIEATYTIDPL